MSANLLVEFTNGYPLHSKAILHFQNDLGSTATDGGARYFTSFLKARIFCVREVPPGRQFVGAVEYQFNVLSKSKSLTSACTWSTHHKTNTLRCMYSHTLRACRALHKMFFNLDWLSLLQDG